MLKRIVFFIIVFVLVFMNGLCPAVAEEGKTGEQDDSQKAHALQNLRLKVNWGTFGYMEFRTPSGEWVAVYNEIEGFNRKDDYGWFFKKDGSAHVGQKLYYNSQGRAKETGYLRSDITREDLPVFVDGNYFYGEEEFVKYLSQKLKTEFSQYPQNIVYCYWWFYRAVKLGETQEIPFKPDLRNDLPEFSVGSDIPSECPLITNTTIASTNRYGEQEVLGFILPWAGVPGAERFHQYTEAVLKRYEYTLTPKEYLELEMSRLPENCTEEDLKKLRDDLKKYTVDYLNKNLDYEQKIADRTLTPGEYMKYKVLLLPDVVTAEEMVQELRNDANNYTIDYLNKNHGYEQKIADKTLSPQEYVKYEMLKQTEILDDEAIEKFRKKISAYVEVYAKANNSEENGDSGSSEELKDAVVNKTVLDFFNGVDNKESSFIYAVFNNYVNELNALPEDIGKAIGWTK